MERLPEESGAIVGNLGIYMAYMLVSSGHLPLMNLILLLAFWGEGLVARVARAQKCLRAQHVQDIAAPAVEMARLLSLMVHLASAVGDSHVFAIATAYIFMLIVAKFCCGQKI